jgi:multiple sugar transport system substrate-binding protein
MVLAVVGCAPPSADPFDNRGPIILVDGPDTSFNRQIAQLAQDWNDRRGEDEKVTFVEMPYATDEYRAQLRARAQDLARGDRSTLQAQCYDVVTMDVIWTAEFARAGYLVPLDANEFRLNTFLSRPVEAVTLDGRHWAVPQRTDAGLLFYRKDILDKEGLKPPKSWDELKAQASVIGPMYGVHGYVGQFDQYEGSRRQRGRSHLGQGWRRADQQRHRRRGRPRG